MTKKLPADPENMNDDRAEWAQVALTAFMERTGTDLCDAVADLLCDLAHWCDRNDIDFAVETERAARNYAEETQEEE